MDSILIKDTTREEREKIVAESIGDVSGSCDGCMAGLAEMYQDYVDGKKFARLTWSFARDMNLALRGRRRGPARMQGKDKNRKEELCWCLREQGRSTTAFVP